MTLGKPLPISYAGHTVWLLPEHALWWPEGRVLFIADLHLGKAATYRALGQPVPSGTTAENLRRLSELIAHYQPAQLVFLGDFLHARQARTASVLGQVAVWRQSHVQLNCVLVRGNHDSRAGDPPAELNIRVVDEPYLVGSGYGEAKDRQIRIANFPAVSTEQISQLISVLRTAV